MPTEPRRNADDFARSAPYADDTIESRRVHPMPTSIPFPLSADDRAKSLRRAERLVGLVVAAALAASIALVFTGCSTPVSQPAVDVPAKFAAAPGLRGRARGRLVGELPATRC